jgi:hypothetical protein
VTAALAGVAVVGVFVAGWLMGVDACARTARARLIAMRALLEAIRDALPADVELSKAIDEAIRGKP